MFQSHYLRDVPFHNCIHAADVTQTTHVLLSAQAFDVSTCMTTLVREFKLSNDNIMHCMTCENTSALFY